MSNATRSSRLRLLTYMVLAAATTGCAREAEPPKTPLPLRAAGIVTYRLPVVGAWRVHRTHYGRSDDQAYALDLVLVADDGGVRRGAGRRNEEYPSYGQSIVADAPGVVVVAVDGLPDNVPGRVNRYDMHGNFVVLDHRNGEFSLFAHLMPGSIRVRPGQFVDAGTELGRCGNSGHSTMPHLHWQVMNDADASSARGVPPRYAPYERNGTLTTALPDRGDIIRAP